MTMHIRQGLNPTLASTVGSLGFSGWMQMIVHPFILGHMYFFGCHAEVTTDEGMGAPGLPCNVRAELVGR